jgi:hypothetical protein
MRHCRAPDSVPFCSAEQHPMPRPSIPRKTYAPSRDSSPWRVYYRGRSYWFRTEGEADAKVEELGRGSITGRLNARQADEYLHAVELLKGTPLLAAVRFYIERQPAGSRTTTVAEAIDDHLKPYAKAADRTNRMSYYDRKVYLLDKLRAAAGDRLFSEIGPEVISSLLAAEGSDWVRNDLLTHLKILFRQAHKRKFIPDDPTSTFDDVETTASKVILSVDDAEHIMRVAEEHMPAMVAPMALQLYLGIRTEEITRLPWSKVRVGELVDIDETVAKTKERRVVDWWPPVLAKWIPKQQSGQLVDLPRAYEGRKVRLIALCRALKKDFLFGQNAARHSFCSFACAYFENASRAMLLAGQRDVNIFFRHYRDYRSRAEAVKYFGFLK